MRRPDLLIVACDALCITAVVACIGFVAVSCDDPCPKNDSMSYRLDVVDDPVVPIVPHVVDEDPPPAVRPPVVPPIFAHTGSDDCR